MRGVARLGTDPAARMLLVFGLSVGLLGWNPDSLSAQSRFLPFARRVEADPNKGYELTQADGPWMIMTASFAGPDASRLAHALVLEIRRELRTEAFVYRHTIDFEDNIEGLGLELNPIDPGRPPVHPRMRHLNLQDFEEWAVVVGEFSGVDDPKATKMLEKVKEFSPSCFADFPEVSNSFRQRELRRHIPADPRRPLRTAFICPNPMLPDDYFRTDGPDRFVYELNKDLEFSLLRCPGKYSLRVATFRGESTFNLQEIEEKKQELSFLARLGRPVESKLAEGADKAHRLTLALRERGVEAWEYHDRTSSYVCVGSYNELLVPGPNGTQVPNPDIVYWTQQFQPTPIQGTLRNSRNQVMSGGLRPFRLEGLDDIPFDVGSVPIDVPRYNIANDYAAPRR